MHNTSQSVSAYLSRLVLPERHARDPHQIHKLLWRAFNNPEMSPPEQNSTQPFLFREEPYAPVAPGEVAVNVQSQNAPDWSSVLGLRVVSCTNVETDFRVGDSFYFRLLASPVRRLLRPEEIHALGHEKVSRKSPREWTRDWLQCRATQAGFEILELMYDLGSIQVRRGKSRFKLASVQFDGQLQIKDADAFAATWLNGIGTKKAFGFGLLSLKRV